MNLTPVQQEVVDSDHPLVAVAATAGSGKSRVLVERIKRLVRQGVNPRTIASISYTIRAAGELKERLEGVDVGFIGTAHGWALRLLRRHGELVGFSDPARISVLNDSTITSMINDLIADNSWKGTLEDLKAEITKGATSTCR
jgi:DNA helicase-2/ATP-dependent DNA helicase PcrA